MTILRHFLRPHKLQPQIPDERLQSLVLIGRNELGRLQELGVAQLFLRRSRAVHILQQPIGNVDMGLAVGCRGILLQDGRNRHH